MTVQQEIGKADNCSQNIVEIMGDTASQLADGLHFLALGKLFFKGALLGRFQREDYRRFIVIIGFHAADINFCGIFLVAFQRDINRLDSRAAINGRGQRSAQIWPVPFDHTVDQIDLAAFDKIGPEQSDKPRIAAAKTAVPGDGCDSDWRFVEEPRKPHFRSAQRVRRITTAGAINNHAARCTDLSVGILRHVMYQPHRHAFAAGIHEVQINILAGRFDQNAIRRQQMSGGLTVNKIKQMQIRGSHFGNIQMQPFSQGRIEIGQPSVRIDRQKSDRRMIQIINCGLQLLKNMLLGLAVLADIRDAPDLQRHSAIIDRQRPDLHIVPVAIGTAGQRRTVIHAVCGTQGDRQTPLFIGSLIRLNDLSEPENRICSIRVAAENCLHTAQGGVVVRARQPLIGRICIDDAPGLIGDTDALRQCIDKHSGEFVITAVSRVIQDAESPEKQAQNAYSGKQSEKAHDQLVGIGWRCVEQSAHTDDEHDDHCRQAHEACRTAASAVCGDILALVVRLVF